MGRARGLSRTGFLCKAGGISLELGARQEGSSGPGLWELMLGQGLLSGLRLAGLLADLGVSGICTIFCADFHAREQPRNLHHHTRVSVWPDPQLLCKDGMASWLTPHPKGWHVTGKRCCKRTGVWGQKWLLRSGARPVGSEL